MTYIQRLGVCVLITSMHMHMSVIDDKTLLITFGTFLLGCIMTIWSKPA